MAVVVIVTTDSVYFLCTTMLSAAIETLFDLKSFGSRPSRSPRRNIWLVLKIKKTTSHSTRVGTWGWGRLVGGHHLYAWRTPGILTEDVFQFYFKAFAGVGEKEKLPRFPHIHTYTHHIHIYIYNRLKSTNVIFKRSERFIFCFPPNEK